MAKDWHSKLDEICNTQFRYLGVIYLLVSSDTLFASAYSRYLLPIKVIFSSTFRVLKHFKYYVRDFRFLWFSDIAKDFLDFQKISKGFLNDVQDLQYLFYSMKEYEASKPSALGLYVLAM